jgi:hypothetical protein
MVRKSICIGILLAAACHAGDAQGDVKRLFGEFSEQEGVNRISIGMAGMKPASLFTKTLGVETVEIVDMENCSGETKARFSQAVGKLKDKDFEGAVHVNEKGRSVRALLRIEGEVIRELIVLACEGDSPAMIRIKGKISKSDIQKLIDGHSSR